MPPQPVPSESQPGERHSPDHVQAVPIPAPAGPWHIPQRPGDDRLRRGRVPHLRGGLLDPGVHSVENVL